MRTSQLLLLVIFANSALSQNNFDSTKVSAGILLCARNIDHITLNPNFDFIDSTRKLYTEEIWLKMPYANNLELFELTNYPNKYVRIQAFDLLVQFRDQIDTALIILGKNTNDTLDYIEVLVGDILYRRNVFENMVKTATEWWKIKMVNNSNFLSREQQALFDKFRTKAPMP